MDAGGAPNVTSVEYWDKVADAWQGEIHNSLREDTGRVIQAALDHFAEGAPLVLDLGCGWGPIACVAAARAPHAEVWAVDVNERARSLTAANAASNSFMVGSL